MQSSGGNSAFPAGLEMLSARVLFDPGSVGLTSFPQTTGLTITMSQVTFGSPANFTLNPVFTASEVQLNSSLVQISAGGTVAGSSSSAPAPEVTLVGP